MEEAAYSKLLSSLQLFLHALEALADLCLNLQSSNHNPATTNRNSDLMVIFKDFTDLLRAQVDYWMYNPITLTLRYADALPGKGM